MHQLQFSHIKKINSVKFIYISNALHDNKKKKNFREIRSYSLIAPEVIHSSILIYSAGHSRHF